MKTIDLNNNESQVSGVFPNHDGSFTAMTFTRSKTFKTEAGAKNWFKQNTQARNYYLFAEVLNKEQQEYNYLFDGKEWLCVECPLTEYCCEDELSST